MGRIIKDDIDQFFLYGIDVSKKTLHVGSEVDTNFSTNVIKGLHVLDSSASQKPIILRMENYGGDVYSGMGIYDFMRRKSRKNQIHVEVYGACMSMAVWILQGADKRLVSQNSRLMIHDGQSSLGENHPINQMRWVEQWKKDKHDFDQLLLQKMQEKKPDLTRDELNQILHFDTIFNAEEAVKWGLADEIIQ